MLISQQAVAGRQIPTRSKIQYLLHVDDCRHRAIDDIVASEAVLAQIKDATESAEFCCQIQHDKEKATKSIFDMQRDLIFLREELRSYAEPIRFAKEQIIEQMSLAQGQRNLILTVAAALFIPMSFVAVSKTDVQSENDC